MKNLLKLLILLGLISACKSRTQEKATDKTGNDSTLAATQKSTPADTTIGSDGGIPIFYNMYLSVEMSSLFHSLGASYNQTLINSPDKTVRYHTSTSKALNLGVYAVDLCYAKYFDQLDQAGKYLQSMHKLTTELGIPDEEFAASVSRIEHNISNRDSLIRIANQLYTSSEKYLKSSNRESAAAFVITGGWTEAMYIAANLVQKYPNDKELQDRIAEQKHSLKNLIDLLNPYGSDPAVKDYLSKLSDLKSSFDKFEPEKSETKKYLNEISTKILNLRKETVN